MAKGIYLFFFILSFSTTAFSQGTVELDDITVNCGSQCNNGSGGGSNAGNGSGNGGQAGNDGDGSQGAGAGGLFIPDGIRFALNNPALDDESSCSSDIETRFNHASIDYYYTIEQLGSDSIRDDTLFVATYANNDREVYMVVSFRDGVARQPEYGCGRHE